MNPLVQAQLDRLHKNLHALEQRQRLLQQDLEEARQTAEDRLKQIWRHEQARNTLSANTRDYDELRARLQSAEEANQALALHAQRIAQWSASLVDVLSQ